MIAMAAKKIRKPKNIAGSPKVTLSTAQQGAPGICFNGQVRVMWVPVTARNNPRAANIQAHPSTVRRADRCTTRTNTSNNSMKAPATNPMVVL